jgi:heterodisulfide reductase subunit A
VKEVEKGIKKAETIVASCKGCGICGARCPKKAILMNHFSDDQLFSQIDHFSGHDGR